MLCWATWFKRLTANGSPDRLAAARTGIRSARTKSSSATLLASATAAGAHLLALPHLRRGDQRATSKHALHSFGRACGRADLDGQAVTQRPRHRHRNHGSPGNENRVANTLASSLIRVDDYNDCDGRGLTTKFAKYVLAEP